MPKYKIAWLPGEGIGIEVLQAARLVLDRLQLDAECLHGDIGREFWRKEGVYGELMYRPILPVTALPK